MPETLADLTLKLSQEISSLEALRSREMAAAEKERDTALLSIAAANEILTRYYQALEKAKQAQIRKTQEADDARHREVLAAEEKRRTELTREEISYRKATEDAALDKGESIRKAQSRWKAAVDKTRNEPLADQHRLRRAADEALERALDEARESYNRAIEHARLHHQAALQDHIVEERLAVEAARRKAERVATGAAIEYERAVVLEEARMRSDIAAYADARRIQEEHDRRLAEIRRSCEAAKEALFQRFSRDRRAARS
jgi:hypothetical protein